MAGLREVDEVMGRKDLQKENKDLRKMMGHLKMELVLQKMSPPKERIVKEFVSHPDPNVWIRRSDIVHVKEDSKEKFEKSTESSIPRTLEERLRKRATSFFFEKKKLLEDIASLQKVMRDVLCQDVWFKEIFDENDPSYYRIECCYCAAKKLPIESVFNYPHKEECAWRVALTAVDWNSALEDLSEEKKEKKEKK